MLARSSVESKQGTFMKNLPRLTTVEVSQIETNEDRAQKYFKNDSTKKNKKGKSFQFSI